MTIELRNRPSRDGAIMLTASSRVLLPGPPSFVINILSPSTLRRTFITSCSTQNSAFASTSTSGALSKPALIGSAPSLQRHLIIHSSHPSTTWPSHLESSSGLYRELSKRWAKHPQLSQLGFGMSDHGVGSLDVKGGKEWDHRRNRFEEPEKDGGVEVYSATLYPDFIEIPYLSISSLPSFESLFLSLPPPPTSSSPERSATSSRRDIYVCTHATRDCRCGDLGEPLYQRLVERAKRRDLGQDHVRIARVAHVGGHKWAANALVYRQGGECDWYGLLRDTDADEVLDLALREGPYTPWWTRWRGRLGVNSEEAKRMHEQAMAPGGTETTRKKRKEKQRDALGDPVKLRFVSWDSVDDYEVTAYEGESVMEAAKRNDLPSILATCGGFCECATCHVHVDVAPSEVGWPEISDEEEEQLDFAMGRKDDSRLGCQLRVTKELAQWVEEGGRIALPRY